MVLCLGYFVVVCLVFFKSDSSNSLMKILFFFNLMEIPGKLL